jgi:pimeloyl-ACP methyl ester carboxylesterase
MTITLVCLSNIKSDVHSQTIPNATLVELSGIGHIPHHETPEKFEKALLEFLDTLNGMASLEVVTMF